MNTQAVKKIKIYKIIALTLLVVFSITAKYFNNVPPVDMRAIVTVLGIDKSEKGIRTSAHILLPVAGAAEAKQVLIESEGRTLSEAIDNLSASNGARVEVSQCGMIVFGRDICDEGILIEARSLFSSGAISAGAILIAAETADAKEFLQKYADMNEEAGSGVNGFISYFQDSMYIPDLTLMKFLADNINESRASFIPCVELKSMKEEEDETEAAAEGGDGGGETGKETTIIDNMSTVVIFRDGKRTARLTGEETRGIVWTDNKSKRGMIQLEKFEFEGKEYGAVFGKVVSKRNRIKVSFKDGSPHVKLKVRASIIIPEKYKFLFDRDTNFQKESQVYKALENEMANQIKKEITAATDAMRLYETDFFTFKYYFYRFKSKEMKRFDADSDKDFLRDLKVDFDIKVNAK